MKRTIGVIAGNGVYPESFVVAARRQSPQIRLVGTAFSGETKPDLEAILDDLVWVKVGQLGKMIDFFLKEGVGEAVMVGQIAPKNLFQFRPDLRTIALLARLKVRNAESLFGAVAEELEKEGITLLPATTFMEENLAEAGHLYGPKPSERQQEDAIYGFHIAKESSRLDIGQSVIVREGTVLAVEAFEGTNQCIERGSALGKGKHLTLSKVSKPKQDLRFDVPVIGPLTILSCAKGGVSQIAIEAGKTLILEPEKVAALARKNRITVCGISQDSRPPDESLVSNSGE